MSSVHLRRMLKAGVLDIRDVDHGEEPFLYSSGWRGCGYVMVKGLVSDRHLLTELTYILAGKIRDEAPLVDFVAGNATGGMIPAWEVARELGLPYVYIRGSRKKGGQKELITGLRDGYTRFNPGSNGLVGEELVNFAETTTNSAVALRQAGFEVTHGMCILSYDHERQRQLLAEHGVKLIYLFTLGQLLQAAEEHGTHDPRLLASYRESLADLPAWNKARGFEQDLSGGTL